MPNTLKIKRSAVSGKVPLTTDLQLGELALNTYDGRLFTKKNNGTTDTIVEIGAGAALADGDKGDITVSSVGSTWTIDAGVVNTTKMGGDVTTAGKALLTAADAAAQRTALASAGTGVSNSFTANQIISVTDNTNAALRVTQLGTGDAIRVEDSTNPDATPFVVSNSGSVGVGTPSPSALLHVQNGAVGEISRFSSDTGNGQNLRILSTSTGMQITSTFTTGVVGSLDLNASGGSSYISLSTAGNERLRVDSAGNVGIGTAAPAYKLDVAGAIGATGTVVMGSSFLRNKVINGAMVIDQRNQGASIVVGGGTYVVDRWQLTEGTDGAATGQRVADAPDGFTHSLKWTTTTADTSLTTSQACYAVQNIEGYNVADFEFGTAAAVTVTVSFWVKSSLTGTFGASLRNSSGTRSYPFNYTISSANTWEYKTVTIPGDTTGAWATDTSTGLIIFFGLGSGPTYSGTGGAWANGNFVTTTGAVSVIGTLNATWQITGVQIEAGSSATPFERRLYGQELSLCQRYYYKMQNDLNTIFGTGIADNATTALILVNFPTSMRVPPTALEQSGTATDYRVRRGGIANTTCSAVPTLASSGADASAWLVFTVASGLTAGDAVFGRAATSAGYLAFTAEM